MEPLKGLPRKLFLISKMWSPDEEPSPTLVLDAVPDVASKSTAPVLVSDPVSKVVSKSTAADEGCDSIMKSHTSPKQVWNIVDVWGIAPKGESTTSKTTEKNLLGKGRMCALS